MKNIVLFVLILVIAFFCNRLFFLKPRYRRMFKKSGNKNRVSISYAVLFDVDSVAKLVQKKLNKSQGTPLYIKAYHVKKKFYSTQTLEQIKQTILSFQSQLDNDIAFNNIYFKDLHEVLIEIWLKCSKQGKYRLSCIKRLKRLYKIGDVNFREMCRLLLMFCDF